MDLVLGSARLGDRLCCHLLDHGHRELSEPQRQDGQREGGGCFDGGGGGGGQLLVADPWGNRGAPSCLCCPPLVVLSNYLSQTAEKEESKTWVSANFSSEQDCPNLRFRKDMKTPRH